MLEFTDDVEYRTVSWLEVEILTLHLIKQIKRSKQKFTRVVGIERGGLHISKPIAEELKLPHNTIKISFYPGEAKMAQAAPLVDLKGVAFSDADHVLFIDDLVDSGSTLKYVKTMLGVSHKYGALFWNPKGKFSALIPDFYVENKEEWLVFPWET